MLPAARSFERSRPNLRRLGDSGFRRPLLCHLLRWAPPNYTTIMLPPPRVATVTIGVDRRLGLCSTSTAIYVTIGGGAPPPPGAPTQPRASAARAAISRGVSLFMFVGNPPPSASCSSRSGGGGARRAQLRTGHERCGVDGPGLLAARVVAGGPPPSGLIAASCSVSALSQVKVERTSLHQNTRHQRLQGAHRVGNRL